MAKSRGGDDLVHYGLDELVNLQEDTRALDGIAGKLFKIFIGDFRKSKAELMKAEKKRLEKEGTEQEKQSAHNTLVRHIKEQVLNSMSDNEKKRLDFLNKSIRKQEQELENLKDIKSKEAENFKAEQALLKARIENAKKEGKTTEIYEKQLQKANEAYKKQSQKTNELIATKNVSIAQDRSETGRIYKGYNESFKNALSNESLVDMTRLSKKDFELNENGSLVDLDYNLKQANSTFKLGELNSFADVKGLKGGRGSLDIDLGDDAPTIRTKPQNHQQAKIERVPSPQERASLFDMTFGDLGSGIVSAVPDKMQQNLNQNMRDDEIAHRTEQESLTDQYREQVLENLKEQTYQLTTIQENLHAIYDNMGQMGGGGFGGGLMDMLSGLFGGALASKGMGLVKGGLKAGAGLAKGALTKIPILGGIAGAGFGAFGGATDTESIMRLKGYTDPSQISWLDRIQSAGAGGLAGAGNGALGFIPNLLGFEFKSGEVLEGVDRWGNILSGKGNKTDAEFKAMQESQTNIDANEAEMNALLASRGIIQTADGSYQIRDNSIHGQILEKMGIETAKVQQEQELAELNEGMGGVMNSSISNVTNNNTTNVIPESPRFRVNDTATMALSAQGL